mmetsp:Transcript_34813/g.70420  ORF Transcript_34813/g.70420 Transcript_34813/m.70420 type:complete len:269 (-) Transcript_34813:193-999(-)
MLLRGSMFSASSTQSEPSLANRRGLDDIFNMADEADQQGDRISTTAIVVIVLATVTAILAALYCCCRKKVKEESQPVEKDEEKDSDTTVSLEPIDLVSCTSECEGGENDNLDTEETIFPCPSDLGRHHSALDVHHCCSAHCLACHQDSITFLAAAVPSHGTEKTNEFALAATDNEAEDETKQEDTQKGYMFEKSIPWEKKKCGNGHDDDMNKELAPLGDGNVRISVTTTNSSGSDSSEEAFSNCCDDGIGIAACSDDGEALNRNLADC